MRIGGSVTTTAKKVFSLPTMSSWISRFASSFCCLQYVELGEDDRRFGRCSSLYSPLCFANEIQKPHDYSFFALLFRREILICDNSVTNSKTLMSKCLLSYQCPSLCYQLLYTGCLLCLSLFTILDIRAFARLKDIVAFFI